MTINLKIPMVAVIVLWSVVSVVGWLIMFFVNFEAGYPGNGALLEGSFFYWLDIWFKVMIGITAFGLVAKFCGDWVSLLMILWCIAAFTGWIAMIVADFESGYPGNRALIEWSFLYWLEIWYRVLLGIAAVGIVAKFCSAAKKTHDTNDVNIETQQLEEEARL